MSYSKIIIEQTPLWDGCSLVVYGFNGDLKEIPEDEYNSNIELVYKGKAIWKVAWRGKSWSNFVGISVSKGKYEAINFDGLKFSLDINTGEIEQTGWTK